MIHKIHNQISSPGFFLSVRELLIQIETKFQLMKSKQPENSTS